MSEDHQLQNLDRLLKNWANNITEATKEIISSAIQGKSQENVNIQNGGNGQIFDDIRDRQSRVISTIQEAHNRQLELLKAAIGEERKEFSRAQLVFEQSLRTKYEHSIEALRETVQSELDSRMIRTLKNLEHQAKLEGERAKQAHDFEYEVENRLTARLKAMISDLRKSWEEEETSRIRQTEEKLRSNYNIVLEHMEAQLRMALQLQEDADEKWLEELDHRNKKQLESIRLFEEKCRKLYETRLIDYAEKTSSQIASYEDKLLEVGSVLASEKNQFESRLRRIKLACSRWKIAYQADIHSRYREMTATLENRYSTEITNLLTEIKELKLNLNESQRIIDLKEKEVKKTQEMYSAGRNASTMAAVQVRNDLAVKWEELKIPPAERIETLTALLDSAQVTPELLALYETINTKLTARQPISQLMNRRQFIEYKLKLATKAASESGPGSLQSSEKAQLITELTDVKTNLDRLLRQYEKDFGEHFNLNNAGILTSTSLLTSTAASTPPMAPSSTTPPMPPSSINVSQSLPQLHEAQKAAPSNEAVVATNSYSKEQPQNPANDTSQTQSSVQSKVHAFTSKATPVVPRRTFPSNH